MRRWLLLLLLCLGTAHADERILDYHSAISVFSDGSMSVTETIRVRAEGKEIKRGIYRDFPTDYTDRYGNRIRVAFDVMKVQRDGRNEAFHTERQSNGVRVYIGNANVFLQPGEYTYSLTYRTDRQLGFFAEHDELYWNVTGNGWNFAMDRASAEVHLPPSVVQGKITAEAYVGPAGSKGQQYYSEVGGSGAYFETTRPLGPREGLTIVVGWPKGHVHEPTREERLGYLLQDNRDLFIAAGGLTLLTIYYLLVWHRVGRDPEAGIVIAQYEPPRGYSPASMRFIQQMGYDHKAFATAIVGLAVKGLIRIEEDDDEYTLHRLTGTSAELGPGEHVLLGRLFAGSSSIVLEQSNHSRIREAIDAHKQTLKNNYDKVFFLTNSLYLIPGILITLATLALTVLVSPSPEDAFGGVFMMVWLSGWTVAVVMLGRQAINAWRSARSVLNYGRAIGTTLFALPFFAFEIFGIVMLATFTSVSMVAVLLAAIGLNVLFYQLLKAPTRAGRALLDKLEGFRLYLDVAEKDELQFKHPPEKTPELFERYLPYAMALDVEQHWAEKFSAVFARLDAQGNAHQPRWYSGRHFDHHHLGGFTSAMASSLSSAISSSSTAPGSSSGGGGGGSSGGGGGGGGGGGW